ncbi:MAG TPA: hypothetical protein VHV10_15200 [Ktedonobacteraceae bacterium]|nr:hypothetical protein [Ktedonobacteraceae bacterium]
MWLGLNIGGVSESLVFYANDLVCPGFALEGGHNDLLDLMQSMTAVPQWCQMMVLLGVDQGV